MEKPRPRSAQLLSALRSRGHTIAFCESLTAGLAAATLADTPGASAVLRGGLITYATDLKVSLAKVPLEVVDRWGVVSKECAMAMATGSREVCGTDWALSLTGVAGPDPQEGKPVGEVWIGIAGPGIETSAALAFDPQRQQELVALGRGALRHGAVWRSFDMLLDILEHS